MLDQQRLERSPVVANNAMNRERGLTGYQAELRFNILEHLGPGSSWLDLCCGQGRALDEVAPLLPQVYLEGLDLVDFFTPSVNARVLRHLSSLESYRPQRQFSLITCVHGLHYVGDKLAAIERALGWLEPDGLFLAHIDCNNIRLGHRPAKPALFGRLGLDYHPRFRLLRSGPRQISFDWRYLGADDRAGPNCTGQPAVNSHYEKGGGAEARGKLAPFSEYGAP